MSDDTKTILIALVFASPFVIFTVAYVWTTFLRWRAGCGTGSGMGSIGKSRSLDCPAKTRRRLVVDWEVVRNWVIALVVLATVVAWAWRSDGTDDCESHGGTWVSQNYGPDQCMGAYYGGD